MAEIVFAGAMSHAPAATGWPETATKEEKDNFYNAAKEIGDQIKASGADVIIGIANDHVLNFNVRNFPNFAIGLSEEHWGPGDWFKSWLKVPDFRLKGDPDTGGDLYRGLVKRGINVASHLENFQYDDNYSVPLTLTGLTTAGIPFVPIMMNCTVPPVLTSEQSYEVGLAFGEAIREDLPEDLKVALLATGGLSHEPGGPKYFVIDEEFDRWALDHLANSDHETIIKEVTYEKMEEAGSGGTAELLSWFVVMAAVGEHKCNVLCYEAPKDWRCGMGAVMWEIGEPIPVKN